MERRKPLLEQKNDLINKEMKTLFSQETRTRSASQNIAVINNTMNTPIDQLDNINFSNAVFNKNFIQMQNFTQNETGDFEPNTFNSNLNTTDAFMSDDLSLMPLIDEKSILSSIKSKFEMRKFYVFIFFFISFFINLNNFCFRVILVKCYCR